MSRDRQLDLLYAFLAGAESMRLQVALATIVAWIASADGPPSTQECEVVKVSLRQIGMEHHVAGILNLVNPFSLPCVQLACEILQSGNIEFRKEALKHACLAAAIDGYLSISENIILRFLAELLALSGPAFDRIAVQTIGKIPSILGDPSSIEWWNRAEQATSSRGGPNTDHTRQRHATADRLKALGQLGLDESASDGDIKSAYRRLSKVHHPDRFASEGTEAVAAATESFKRIQTAYELLTSK